jgi:short-subunit dehydrogenase
MIPGTRIWLTGASSGIGLMLAERLLQDGHRLVLSARRQEPMAYLLKRFPESCRTLPLDVGDTLAVRAAASVLPTFFGGIDVIILNAGICEYVNIDQFNSDQIERVVNINLFGASRCLEIGLPLLGLSGSNVRPHIVSIGSLADRVPFPRAQAYGSSKAALRYFMECMRLELRERDIDVSFVEPGFVATPMSAANDFPMPFMLSPEQAVEYILKGIERRKAVISFPKALAWPLILGSLFGPVWRAWIGPWLSRREFEKTGNKI